MKDDPYFLPTLSVAHHRETVATLQPISFDASVAVFPMDFIITPVKRFANTDTSDYSWQKAHESPVGNDRCTTAKRTYVRVGEDPQHT